MQLKYGLSLELSIRQPRWLPNSRYTFSLSMTRYHTIKLRPQQYLGVGPRAIASAWSSLPGITDADAKRLSGVLRTHGEIENRVQGVLDVAMGEDANRTRAGESAQKLA
jgi:hypothetical protein